MRKQSSPRIVVGPNDSMPDVLTRLRTASGGSASLAIPAASSLLLTASEFRALKSAAEHARIALTVETDDRLRKQLATMFKIPVVDLLPGAITTLTDSTTSEPTTEAPKPESVIPDLPKIDLPPPLEVAPRWTPRDTSGDDEPVEDEPELPAKKRSLRVPWKIISIAAAAVLVLMIAAGSAAYFLQKATVTLTLKREQVSADLTYAVVSPDAEAPAGAAFSITAAPVTMSVPFQKTVNVTGALREPDQIATGTLALRNPTDAAIEIPAGTAFADRLGIEYVFTAAVSVPATDAAGAGRAEGQIQAKIGGENANREIGLLSGKLDNGIYYSNRDAPVAGGTDKKTPQVSQEDIDQLIADARAEIPRLAVTSTLNDGRIVLPGSIQAGELQYTIDRAVGEQVDTISIQAEMVVTGMAFLPADANAQASEDLQLALARATPASFELESATIAFAPPVLVNDQGDAGLYKLTATASVRASVDQAQRDAAADEIAGMDVDEAETYLRSLPFVADVKIESSPGFLPVRIPGSAGKIEIETT